MPEPQDLTIKYACGHTLVLDDDTNAAGMIEFLRVYNCTDCFKATGKTRPPTAPSSPSGEAPAECRVCGCTDLDCRGCIARTGKACHWVEPDLCSACVGGSSPSGEAKSHDPRTLTRRPLLSPDYVERRPRLSPAQELNLKKPSR